MKPEFTIKNACDTPLNSMPAGNLPNVSGALTGYYQPMVFTLMKKDIVGGYVQETPSEIPFQGTWQPYSDEQLKQVPEGQRSWKWFWMHAEPVLNLLNDDVVTWNGVKTRVMSKKDYSLYGFIEYRLVQDWEGT